MIQGVASSLLIFLKVSGEFLLNNAEIEANSSLLRFQRPLLVLLDRNMDMATPLHHTWTYQALVHDVLEFNLNRVTFQEDESSSTHQEASRHTPSRNVKKKECDLNPTDNFWVAQRGLPFPNVAEAIQEELERYKESEGEVKRLKESMVLTIKSFFCWIFMFQFIIPGIRSRQ